ncbi:MAG: hypothetical protein IJX80_08740 [Clostridia bacterium]|nr:hypothetical protein [Clostridia bacterium]
MKREKISEAMGNISSRHIKEAAEFKVEEKPHRSKTLWVKWVSIAACFCLIITGVFAAFQIGLFDNNELGGANSEIIPDIDGNTNPDIDNDEYNNIFSIANGSLYLEIYDAYTIPNEADVITIYLIECKGNSEVFFRSSNKIADQVIRRIESTDGKQVATNDNGVFTLDFLEGQDFVYLNLYFDAGTFKKSVEINGGTGGNDDVDYDPNAPIDEDIYDDHASSTTAIPATVYFECSAILPDRGYDEIHFSRVLSAISNEPKVNIFGTTDSLEEAVNAVGLQALLLFEEYTPTNISYRKTNETGLVRYQYGVNATVTVHIYEYYKIDYTLDTFVYSTDVIDYDLYPLATETAREKDGLPYSLHVCYKNDNEWKSEIAVLNYTGDGNNIFFVVQFDLSGENVEQDVKLLLEQMTLVK